MSGESKYGISRVVKVMADLFTIQMITRFRENPIRWFALIGTPFFLGSLLTSLLAVWSGGTTVIATVVSLEFGMVFVTCVFAGLIGEAIIDSSGRTPPRKLGVREWGETQ